MISGSVPDIRTILPLRGGAFSTRGPFAGLQNFAVQQVHGHVLPLLSCLHAPANEESGKLHQPESKHLAQFHNSQLQNEPSACGISTLS